jgi:hypothetical protein
MNVWHLAAETLPDPVLRSRPRMLSVTIPSIFLLAFAIGHPRGLSTARVFGAAYREDSVAGRRRLHTRVSYDFSDQVW